MKALAGNDLVDLDAGHNRGRAAQPRFLARTLTVAERDRLVLARDADHAFALLWSAKEAAYKAVRKRERALVFAPRRWQVDVDSLTASAHDRRGRVTIGDERVDVQWQQGDGWLHCIALLGGRPALLDHAVATAAEPDLARALGEREQQGLSCNESVAVRNLAKRLLRRHGFDAIEIRREGAAARLPPVVHVGGTPSADLDLSLSHDGRFVAAVIVAGA